MDNNELLNKKISKISPNQTFFIMILIVVVYSIYSLYSKHEDNIVAKTRYESSLLKSDEIIGLLTQMVNNKVNIVNKEGAKRIYEKTFNSSACDILDKAMHTLSVNNVHDSLRQIQIANYYYRAIENMYMDDKQMFSNYRYKGKRLDGVMVNINPNDVTKTVLNIMFSDIETNQKRLDIRGYLYSQFDEFLNMSQVYLNNEK